MVDVWYHIMESHHRQSMTHTPVMKLSVAQGLSQSSQCPKAAVLFPQIWTDEGSTYAVH